MEKKKVIIVSTVGLIYDGITSVILSYLQAMNLSKLDIYVVSTMKCEQSIKKSILDLGCHIVELPSTYTKTPLFVSTKGAFFSWLDRERSGINQKLKMERGNIFRWPGRMVWPFFMPQKRRLANGR